MANAVPEKRSPVESPNSDRIRASMPLSRLASGMRRPTASTVPGTA